MNPNETLFLESTSKVATDDVRYILLFSYESIDIFRSFIDIKIEDFPGHWNFDQVIFQNCGALVFVIDVQDDYLEALQKLYSTVKMAYQVNPRINFEVFIHKVDGLSDDYKIETQRDINQRLNDEFAESGIDGVHLSFYLTSIYDHSIFEAFSKVIQKLIPQLPTLESLLNILCSNSGIEKAFLFDVISKIYIATDSSPVDIQSYELCSNMIDVVLDMSLIYGKSNHENDTSFHVDQESYSVIRLNNGVLYMRPVNSHLVIVCLIREDSFEKQGLIDYNFRCLANSIDEILS